MTTHAKTYTQAISCDQRTAVADDVTFKFAFAQVGKVYNRCEKCPPNLCVLC